jgi:putative hydrolase of the HAD superfamily
MMSIKAVVFDFGNVISFPPDEENQKELARLTGLPAETLRDLDKKHRGEYDRGTYDGAGYYRFILSGAGAPHDEERLAEIARVDGDGWKRINGETVALMRDVKAAGFKLGILSNMPQGFLDWARQNIPVFSEADVSVFSCEYNLIKPEAAIYGVLREKLSLAYKEIVFFDDLPDNIQKARELGIEGLLWQGPAAAREALRNMDPAFGEL